MYVEYRSVSRAMIVDLVAKRGGTVAIPGKDTNLIPEKTDITLMCRDGHSWHTIAADIGQWCAICKLLAIMHQCDRNIRCVQQEYVSGQINFEFVCGLGHTFVARMNNCKRGCRSCDTLAIAHSRRSEATTITMDCLCVNTDDSSRLRFHCSKLRHDPMCSNEECVAIREKTIVSDYVQCDQDFYATPRQIKMDHNILNCDTDHRWHKNVEIVTLARMFEIQFDVRFDDRPGANIVFTGYNRELQIAFTHCNDQPANRCIAAARSWCAENAVKFVVIGKNITDTRPLSVEMMTQLHALGCLERAIQHSTKLMRTRMRQMNNAHKLYDDRCEFFPLG